MQLSELLSPARTRSQVQAENKKRAFEIISKMAADELRDTNPKAILTALTERERLGSTAIGHSIAMPHVRLINVSKPFGILLSLQQPILYDEQDQQYVDILVALFLPQKKDEECLQCLCAVAKLLRQKSFQEQLHQAMSDAQLYELITSQRYAE